MAGRRASLLLAALLATSLAGCGTTAPSSFYTLDSSATQADGAPVAVAIMVGPVSIPAAVDRPEFVVQVA
ncbi:MAG TPA: hypothetical protein VFC77_05925, partial [Myxococcota bacterium]|nr:hypothetical protein [Myxococcota bacterium]